MNRLGLEIAKELAGKLGCEVRSYQRNGRHGGIVIVSGTIVTIVVISIIIIVISISMIVVLFTVLVLITIVIITLMNTSSMTIRVNK